MPVIHPTLRAGSAQFEENLRAYQATRDGLREAQARSVQGGEEKARALHHSRGKLMARERIARLIGNTSHQPDIVLPPEFTNESLDLIMQRTATDDQQDGILRHEPIRQRPVEGSYEKLESGPRHKTPHRDEDRPGSGKAQADLFETSPVIFRISGCDRRGHELRIADDGRANPCAQIGMLVANQRAKRGRGHKDTPRTSDAHPF